VLDGELALDVLEGAADQDAAGGEVDVGPFEVQQLAFVPLAETAVTLAA
jgi:hypothetical protein